MSESFRVGISAQVLPDDGTGGVAVAVSELIAALGRLNLTDSHGEEYVIINLPENHQWLQTFLSGNQRLAYPPVAHTTEPARDAPNTHHLKNYARGYLSRARPALKQARDRISRRFPYFTEHVLPISGWVRYERARRAALRELECEVLHFPTQFHFIQTDVPSVYNPHDLQHLHFPEFFSEDVIKLRERIYRHGCAQSQVVVVGSQWIKDDVVRQYGVNPDKVQVIPWATPTRWGDEPTSESLMAVKTNYALQQPFMLYPAMTAVHKNHLRLIEAVARVRDTVGLDIDVVCTGYRSDFFPRIAQHLEDYNLTAHFRFPGHVSVRELRSLYRLSEFVIIPSLFEAASGPMFEAWREQVPVACSSVTSLPEQANGAALLFDAYSVDSIADAIITMKNNGALRRELIVRGLRRLQDFSWTRTARAYRAVYKRAAGKKPDDEEQRLLAHDWMREPLKIEA